MENYSNEAHTPYGGYRGAATAQPLEAPNDFQASSPESYHPPAEGGYQQQEQFYGSQQHYGYQQPYFAPLQALAVLMKEPRWVRERALPVG